MKKIISLVMALSLACVPVYANNTVPIEATSATVNEAFAEDYTMETADISDPYADESETIVTPVAYEMQANLSSKRQAVVDRAYAWYNKTWTLTQPMLLWHNPATSSGVTVPAGTTVRGVPYTQFNCLYSIDSTLPGSKNYFELNEASTYETVVDTYCAGVGGNRTAPKYGAECVQLVYDAWYHGDDSIGKRGDAWSLIIGDNKKRGLVDEIKYADIQPGDALAISSHIRLVVGINDNNTPNDCTDDTYECIEQTTANLGNKNIGTAKITYTYSQLHNGGYLPYRYNNLDDGSTPDPEPDPEPINFYGYVYNGTSGEEIMGVTVTFKTEDNVIDAVVTDEYGRFEFTTTDAKKNYTFVFSKSGFDTYTSAAITISESYTYLGKIALYEEESPAHIVDSGTCGDNLQWAYYTNGTLMIYGTGDMTDYSQTATGYPWNEYILSSSSGDLYLPGIKKAVLCDGITSLSSQAFVKKRTDYTLKCPLSSRQ